ncbi:DUF5677 domain-containing protein [Paraflavitalea sp. CAU 1676]|uniref:DUF5677 domain-containing protein n=1 Tax=Paraflavitalea sp. CAU 1676 TaxID=3032598 RepID=UPI0023DA2D6E|nr:DUF5677 domain-containing protein [Paraflavitalea sp. CAU 1676]MDF2188296.1 DUF5677 domain-containing protein [Paraflavitalea sp. CAU 1676]
MEFQGLISDDIIPLLDKVLEKVRTESKVSHEEMDKLMREGGDQFFDILEDKCAEFFVNKYTIEEFRQQYGIVERNSKKIVELHEELFHHFFSYIHTSNLVYSRFIDKLQKSRIEPSKLEFKDSLNLTFYGNLCRMADQIGLELVHGYPDAALRLWRIFYEHCVVAVFLMKQNSNELAERFRDVTYKENKRSVESYIKRHEILKFPAISEELVNDVMREYEEAKGNYQKDFFDNDYSWAKPFLNGKGNFLAIEEAAEMGRYRPFYIWASTKVHPTYKGVMDFRDDNNSIVLNFVTVQDTRRRSLVDPAQLTLATFHEVNSHFLHLYSGHEYTVNLMMFRKIHERFQGTITDEKVNSTHNS